MSAPVRVLLVDDHPVVRAGLRGMLAGVDGVEVVGEAGDGEAALAAVATTGAQVVLMDLSMPVRDGASATAAIRAAHRDVQVVVLTTYDEDRDIAAAIAAGAVGYLLKDCGRDALLAAVHAAARGESVLAPGVAARLAQRAPAAPALTPREVEVLAGVAAGRSNKEIARDLDLGEATVKTHLLHAFARLGVGDRTAAVLRAMELGLLPRAHPG